MLFQPFRPIKISRALAFLNDDAKMAHNAVRMDAIFVTTAGEWKLGGLDFVHSIGQPPQSNRTLASFSNPTQTGDGESNVSDVLFEIVQ